MPCLSSAGDGLTEGLKFFAVLHFLRNDFKSEATLDLEVTNKF